MRGQQQPRPHFVPRKDSVPILQEAGWAPGPVWTGGKSRPYRDSIPDRPARSSVAIPTELPGPHEGNTDIKTQNASNWNIFSLHSYTYRRMKRICENLHELITYEVRRISRSSVTFFVDQMMLRNLHEVHEMNAHIWGNTFPSLSLFFPLSLNAAWLQYNVLRYETCINLVVFATGRYFSDLPRSCVPSGLTSGNETSCALIRLGIS